MLLSVHLRIAIVDDAEVASFSGHHLQPDDGTSDGMCSFKGSQGVSFINAFHTDDRTKPHREDSQVKGRLLAGGREGKESVCVCVWGGGGVPTSVLKERCEERRESLYIFNVHFRDHTLLL